MGSDERGIVLVQVVVMAVLLGLMASYLVEWSFQRYQVVARHQEFNLAAGSAQGCVNQVVNANYQSLVAGALPAAGANLSCENPAVACPNPPPVGGCFRFEVGSNPAGPMTVRWGRNSQLQ